MRKEIYLVKGIQKESYKQFSSRILLLANALSEDENIVHIKIVFTNEPPPRLSVIPFKKKKVAAISILSTQKENNKTLLIEPGFSGGYLVEEALPVAYKKDWEDGQTTPGVCLLTLFRQKKRIDYDTFLYRWHKRHTPLSLKIHPLWHYNRNVIHTRLTSSSSTWDGIVEEHMRSRSELLNPTKFFGNSFIMLYNMIRVYFDTKSFLDYKSIEPYLTTEIHIKS